jgi:hypothetical protein
MHAQEGAEDDLEFYLYRSAFRSSGARIPDSVLEIGPLHRTAATHVSRWLGLRY